MLNERTLALLNQEVDGTNTPKESEKVRSLLAKDPEARKVFDSLKELAVLLKSTPSVEPPSTLKSRILSSLPAPRHHQPAARFPLFAMIATLREQSHWRTGLTFAGGAIAGILAFVLLNGTPPETTQLVGTIGSRQSTAVESSSAEIELSEVRGSLSARREDGLIRSTATLDASQEISFVLVFDEARLQFDRYSSSGQTPSQLRILPGRLELTVAGHAECEFIFRTNADDRVSLNGEVIIGGMKQDLAVTLERQ